jgi:hypothetical protein
VVELGNVGMVDVTLDLYLHYQLLFLGLVLQHLFGHCFYSIEEAGLIMPCELDPPELTKS